MTHPLVWVFITHHSLPSFAANNSLFSINNKCHLGTQVCKHTHTLPPSPPPPPPLILLFSFSRIKESIRQTIKASRCPFPAVNCFPPSLPFRCSIEFNQYFLEPILSVENTDLNKILPLPSGCPLSDKGGNCVNNWECNMINKRTEILYDLSEVTKPMTKGRWLEFRFLVC